MARKRASDPPPQPPPPRYVNDSPAADDALDDADYKTALETVILTSRPPFTIGLFGEWGAGKSTLMQALSRRVKASEKARPVWFNAWLYANEPGVGLALIRTVIDVLDESKGDAGGGSIEKARGAAMSLFSRLQLLETARSAAIVGAGIGASLLTSGIVNRRDVERATPRIAAAERAAWRALTAREEAISAFRDAIASVLGEDERLVVFIDDLDRCAADEAVALLETIKFFFDDPNAVFVLGADRAAVESFLDQRYAGVANGAGRLALEKLIQFPFNMRVLDPSRALSLLDRAQPPFSLIAPDAYASMGEILVAAFEGNPRRIKRFGNVFTFFHALRRDAVIDDAVGAAFVIALMIRFPAVFELFALRRDLFRAYDERADSEKDRAALVAAEPALAEIDADPAFHSFFAQTRGLYPADALDAWWEAAQSVSSKS